VENRELLCVELCAARLHHDEDQHLDFAVRWPTGDRTSKGRSLKPSCRAIVDRIEGGYSRASHGDQMRADFALKTATWRPYQFI